jgi:hypothetical protein
MAIFKIENYVRFTKDTVEEKYHIYRKSDGVYAGYLSKKDGQWGAQLDVWVDWGTSHDVFMQLVILNNMERLNQEEK